MIRIGNNKNISNSKIIKDGKVIFHINKNYSSLSDKDKIESIDFMIKILNYEKSKVEDSINIKLFNSKYDLKEEVIKVKKDIHRYLSGGKFKTIEALEMFIGMYYVKQGYYFIPNSVLQFILKQIKNECCEEE